MFSVELVEAAGMVMPRVLDNESVPEGVPLKISVMDVAPADTSSFTFTFNPVTWSDNPVNQSLTDVSFAV